MPAEVKACPGSFLFRRDTAGTGETGDTEAEAPGRHCRAQGSIGRQNGQSAVPAMTDSVRTGRRDLAYRGGGAVWSR
ncbi:hypothetical protein ASZ90_010817 [hydrocarbon metagenome]|uniref:Uncharacterized protein n=1 Tax=hydrocarbon metagenome TaxID=938273 RepID=A0A0W8FF18_9ZZZZ